MTNDIPLTYPEPYTVIDGCLCKMVSSGRDKSVRRLCNFTAHITGEIIFDDGLAQERFLKISGSHCNGIPLAEIKISVTEFNTMNWIASYWGATCNPESGYGIKDSIRHAIQTTAENISPETVYTHLGWRVVDGKWRYLMPGQFENCTPLTGSLRAYGFKAEDNEKNILAGFHLFNCGVAPNEALHPLLSFMYLAPLCEFLSQAGCRPKTVLALVGKTGSKKSTLAALALSHFGRFENDSLPLTFRDTANSILERLFLLKDVPAVIDDFHPSTKNEEAEMNATAQLVMRAFGDHTARGRMRSDLTLAQPKPPRGIGIITAEHPPSISESGTARYLTLELTSAGVNIDLLSVCQKHARADEYSATMHGYIDWLGAHFVSDEEKTEKFIEGLKYLFEQSRKQLHDDLIKKNIQFHDRVPEACAFLYVGYYFAMNFFYHSGRLSKEQEEKYNKAFYSLLLTLAERQSKNITHDNPAEKFIYKLSSLIDSGGVSVPLRSQADGWFANLVGYQDEDYFYLITDAAHKAVKKLCDEQGESFSISARTLLANLDEAGYIEAAPGGGRTRTLHLSSGKYIRVAFVKKKLFAETVLHND